MDIENVKNNKARTDKYYWQMESIVLFVVMLLSVLGIGITEFRPLDSYRYWGVMTLILAATAFVIGWVKSMRNGLAVRDILTKQIVHWAATMVAVGGIFILLNTGRLNYENTGLVLLITLGLSTFLDGYRVSLGFALVGVMMFLTGIIGGYVEQYVWIILIIIVSVFITIIVIQKSTRPSGTSSKNI